MDVAYAVCLPVLVSVGLAIAARTFVEGRYSVKSVGASLGVVAFALFPFLIARSAAVLMGRDAILVFDILARASVVVTGAWYLGAWLWPKILFRSLPVR